MEGDKFEVLTPDDTSYPLVKLAAQDGAVVIDLSIVHRSPILQMLIARDGHTLTLPFSQSVTTLVVDLLMGDIVTEQELSVEVITWFIPEGPLPLNYLRFNPTREEVGTVCGMYGWTNVLEMAAKWYQSTGEHNYNLYDLAGVGPLMRLILTEILVPLDELKKVRIINLEASITTFLRENSKLLGIESIGTLLVAALRRIVKLEGMSRSLAIGYHSWAVSTWSKNRLHAGNLLVTSTTGWKTTNRNILGAIDFLLGE